MMFLENANTAYEANTTADIVPLSIRSHYYTVVTGMAMLRRVVVRSPVGIGNRHT